MRHLLLLAAAVTFAVGCHSRTEDEVGAAPDRGEDTTAVTAADTAMAAPTDTTMGEVPAEMPEAAEDTGAMPEDTSADSAYAPADPSAAGEWTDTTGVAPEAAPDSAVQQ
jgi:hypothetical protein